MEGLQDPDMLTQVDYQAGGELRRAFPFLSQYFKSAKQANES